MAVDIFDTDALHPSNVVETLEENLKWLGLLNVDLPTPDTAVNPAYGKELMIVEQPFVDWGVCIPGEVGFHDLEAAAEFEAAIAAANAASVYVVPDPPDQGVCIAGPLSIAELVDTCPAIPASSTVIDTDNTADTAAEFTARNVGACVGVTNATAIVTEPAIAGERIAHLNTVNIIIIPRPAASPDIRALHIRNSTRTDIDAALDATAATDAILIFFARIQGFRSQWTPYSKSAHLAQRQGDWVIGGMGLLFIGLVVSSHLLS